MQLFREVRRGESEKQSNYYVEVENFEQPCTFLTPEIAWHENLLDMTYKLR